MCYSRHFEMDSKYKKRLQSISKIINEYFALKIREYFDESMINNGGKPECFL